MTDMLHMERMTLHEYHLRMHAYQLATVDKEYYIHLQAWANHAVKSEKKKGKNHEPVYKTFKDFFDYEKHVASMTGEMNVKEERLRLIARRQREFKERREKDGNL